MHNNAGRAFSADGKHSVCGALSVGGRLEPGQRGWGERLERLWASASPVTMGTRTPERGPPPQPLRRLRQEPEEGV